MFTANNLLHRSFRLILAVFFLSVLSACQVDFGSGGKGPAINSRAPVPVALLVPFGSEESSNDVLAASLQNAAQLAVSDLGEVKIDLRVYPTGGTAEQAAIAAHQAVSEGAKILLGPVFGDAAVSAGAAVASRNVSLLSFSNNTEIAGGNIFVLGHTYQNTANRLIEFASTKGYSNVMVVHADNIAGEIGRKAVESATLNSGVNFTGAGSYEFSQMGVVNAVPVIADQARETGTEAIIFASDTAGALPILSQLLPENGITTDKFKFLGLTRWDIPTQTLALSGLQGGWFALPDPALTGAFTERYSQAYGARPHPLAGIAYDGIAAIGALVSSGGTDAFSRANLTQSSGFAGVSGVFRLLEDGTNERSLAVAEVDKKRVKVIDPAPRVFRATGLAGL